MAAAKYDIVIEKGTDYSLELTWKDSEGSPIDLTGYTARMQVRPSVMSPEVLLEATTENGNMTLGGTSGGITIAFSNVETTPVDKNSGVYDLEIVSPTGSVKRLLEGGVTLKPEVTR